MGLLSRLFGSDRGAWETKRSSAKNCTQVIFRESSPVATTPRIKNQLMNAPLMACTWGLWPVKLADCDPMDLYAKASGVASQLRSLPCTFAFAFYPFPEAALLQFFLEIRHDRSNPFVVECSCDLANAEMKQAFEEIVNLDVMTIHFLNANMSSAHSRQLTKSPDAKEEMSRLWSAALRHDGSISRGARNFQMALQRYNMANPMEASPII